MQLVPPTSKEQLYISILWYVNNLLDEMSGPNSVSGQPTQIIQGRDTTTRQ